MKILAAIALFGTIVQVDAFLVAHPTTNVPTAATFPALRARRRNRSAEEADSFRNSDDAMPQLPAASSYDTDAIHINNNSNSTAFVGAKFELQYTCNVCETRNCHRVSRLAYRQGVVIARCKGCSSQHLIADNLGWTDYKGGFEGEVNDIEDFFAGQQEQVVNRVSREVFDLEKVLSVDTKSGSLVNEDGELSME